VTCEAQKLHPAQSARLEQFNTDQCSDIHSHCLPGLDDGPADLPAALALCQQLVEDGITTVVATPHQLGQVGHANLATRVRAEVQELRAVLAEEQINLQVLPGGDVRIDPRMPELLDLDAVLTVADNGKYMLLELPHDVLINLSHLLVKLRERGVTAILTHPERHRILVRQPIHLLPWIEQGLLLQITAGSLVGEFGEAAERAAWDWLGSGLVTLVASDAHGVDRPPRMSAAIEAISNQLSRPVARRVCIENPNRVVRGEPITTTPERLRLVGRP
jgi:protein-tyrosine phosphatase